MARFRLGETNAARLALADCDKLIATKLPKLSSKKLGPDWVDWVFAHALEEEARAVLQVQTHEP